MSKSKIRVAPLAPACVFLGMVLCMLVPAACDPRPISTGATVSDSAGVRIVELDFGFDGPAERRSLASEPDRVIRFPEDDPALAISGIADVEVLSDGRIAVAADGENSILVFDTAGNHLDTWGGTGDGPGEFVRLDWLARRAPDSLAAGEVRVRQVSILDTGGQFARTFGTGSALTATDGTVPPQALGLLADGTVVGAFFEQPEAVEGAVRPPVEIVAIPPAGDTVLSVGTWPGDELSLFRRDGFLEVVAPPFARRLHVATAPDGIWIADDASLEIREYSGQARLRTVVRSSASPHSVSDALLEQRIADKYRSAAQGPALERLKRDQRRLAHHETMPRFGAVLGVMGGGVAVSEYQVGGPPSRTWIVVDTSGGVALVDLPAGLEVKRWGQDWVIGVVRDELDREEVHRYRILDTGRE
ncbi:MAG: hypothetical protein OXI83_04965 [Gemmatimonadota bacterium]|nr:hypothetical protein [Gemmatimonadota bacterium]